MRRPADQLVHRRTHGFSVLLALLALLLSSGCSRPAPAPVVDSAPAAVAFWGDSLFEGFPKPPFAADGSDSVPGAFAAHNPGSKVYNGGISGQLAAEIAVRQGGLPLRLTVAGGVIPPSGDVAVVPADTLGWRLDRYWGDEGTIAGVPGVLERDLTAFRFRRSAPGAAVPVSDPQPFVSGVGAEHRDDVQVLLAGRNDIGYVSPAGDPVSRVVAATRAMVNFLPSGQRALVCGTITAIDEGQGTEGYDAVVSINDQLAAAYPYSYWDMRAWLVHDAIYALKITPTPEDLADMAADTLPPSIMVPGETLHYSPATAAALADEIRVQLTNRGWAG
jgi:hypothetical protein